MKVDNKLEQYIIQHIDRQDEVLAQLERETHVKIYGSAMISGNLQGNLLNKLVKMAGAQNVLEIGTFTGYSAICMAKALPGNGHLVTIEADDELESLIRKYLALANVENQVELRIGNALQVIPALTGPFDLVFIDADKAEYCDYYRLVFDKIPSGGWILADNTLWYGHVVEADASNDNQTRGIMEFNEMIALDHRVEKVILPIRDGLSLIRKK